MSKQNTAVAVNPKAGAVVVSDIDDSQLIADAGSGSEKVGAGDLAIPFLQVLQSGSPQCKKSSGSYIPGASEGVIWNNVTHELFPEGVEVVPVFYEKILIEWKDREAQGGGFVATYKADDPIRGKAVRNPSNNRDYLPNGHILSEHAQHYCLHIKPDGQVLPVLLTMTSTQLKKSRRWNSLMQMEKIKGPNGFVTPPTFAFSYIAKPVAESKDQYSWFGWDIQKKGRVAADVYNFAKEFWNSVKAGRVSVNMAAAENASAEPSLPF